MVDQIVETEMSEQELSDIKEMITSEVAEQLAPYIDVLVACQKLLEEQAARATETPLAAEA